MTSTFQHKHHKEITEWALNTKKEVWCLDAKSHAPAWTNVVNPSWNPEFIYELRDKGEVRNWLPYDGGCRPVHPNTIVKVAFKHGIWIGAAGHVNWCKIDATGSSGILCYEVMTPYVEEVVKTVSELNPEDVRIDIFRITSNGYIHKPATCVRITHLPTGITVEESEDRSVHMNRAIAWDILKYRLAKFTEATARPSVGSVRKWLWLLEDCAGGHTSSSYYSATLAEAQSRAGKMYKVLRKIEESAIDI